ncbi:MAG: hypothetical protein BMS9Abin11_0875 [Gammaproteobacteria bacterium]|nr:MAG: hypothetical protein BMS9Abin11_0875 [Gammaproteobacteria bacterium]
MADENKQKGGVGLFRKLMSTVRPLKQDKISPYKKSRKPIAHKREEDDEAVMDSLLSDDYEPEYDTESGEELFFARPGLQRTVLRKLRRGKFVVEAELDLHRNKAPEAREKISVFIRNARQRDQRCVRIIHGKGLSSSDKLPVLKGKVNSWLRQKDDVLAFCSALPRDGGTGAVYVLLKR